MSKIHTSRALVVCHRGTYLDSSHTGLVMDRATFVIAILESAEVEDVGLRALAGGTVSVEGFFEELDIDRLDANGPWIIEVRVDVEASEGEGWERLGVAETRRPTDEELLDAMYGRGGWKVL